MSASVLRAKLRLRRSTRFALNIDLVVAAGVTVLLGPSGTGKSTTLDLLAGHALPDAGRIELCDELLFARNENAPPTTNFPVQRRRIGYVMQAPALFPHLDVRKNLLYGLHGWPRQDAQRRLREISEALGLAPLLERQPDSLSGGERQRVALGRALAPEPRALLLDEPLSAVDLPSRDALLGRLRELLGALAIPVLYVTHSAEEQNFFASLGRPTLRLCADGTSDSIEVVAISAS